jgi:ATP-dependent DNA ligase
MKTQFIFPPKPTSTKVKPPNDGFYEIAAINKNFVVEKKKNGWATVIVKIGNKFTYYTRHKNLLDRSIIPTAIEELESLDLPHTVILGGEAIGRRTKNVRDLLYLYAVYQVNDEWMNTKSLKENREILKSLVKPTSRIEIAQYYTEQECPKSRFDNFYYEAIKDEEVEGIILKDVTKPIKIDFQKSLILPYWFKFKEREDA